MKIFISQPMKNRSNEEIRTERRKIMEYVQKIFPDEKVEEINSYFDMDIQSKNTPLKMLGMSLELLAEADVAVFADGWSIARGCRIENEASKLYGIQIIDLE